jgi:cyanophycin synthetase
MQTRENDFDVKKFYFYNGPNHYLPGKALVFNLYISPEGPESDFYKPYIFEVFPYLEPYNIQTVADLFAHTLLEVLRMDINLYINDFAISEDGEEYIIAIEYLDDYTAEDAVMLISDWFKAINKGTIDQFNFRKKFDAIKEIFDKSILGGPTLYSLVETGMKNDIPVFFLEEENQFQWGYGRKQLRARSTTMHTDGIKDTEFTMYKDMVTEFLKMCGFPTPKGRNCFTEAEALSEAHRLGFPVVVKPVAGHKGIGVTTGIKSESEVLLAFQNIIEISQNEGINFDGAIVQQHITGHDHRLLTVDGKFVAALKRIPAYVDGNGLDTIEKLIQFENKTEIRLDNARSPLAKIKIDKDLIEFLLLQKINLNTIPAQGERVFLRRVANISAGGVSINVTENIHPKNIELCESIAAFFNVKCLGIDVLSDDISKPWNEGSLGIIEINAGPGVFMHLAPAYGGSINVPEIILLSHFKKPENSRIPIIAGNNITASMISQLKDDLFEIDNSLFVGALVKEGVFFNNKFFFKNEYHDQNVKIILRHPKTDFAIFNHDKEDIYDFGFFHQGADIIILDHPNYAEETLRNQLMPAGYILEVFENEIKLSMNSQTLKIVSFTESEKEQKILALIKPLLKEILLKYTL